MSLAPSRRGPGWRLAPARPPVDHPIECALAALAIALAALGYAAARTLDPAPGIYAALPPADPATSQLPALVTLAALAIKCLHSYLVERLRSDVRELRRRVAEYEAKDKPRP